VPKKIVLDFDDWSIINNKFDLLLKLKEHYPKLKVSLFTIPCHAAWEFSTSHIFRDEALKQIKKNLDWIQIIPHGLSHVDREFEKADKTSVRLTLKAIEEIFSKDEIPYVKGFKAPQWLWNQDVVDVLDKEGWFGAIDRNQPQMLSTKKFYRYNFQIYEPFYISDLDVWKLHGHINPETANDIEKCFLNLMKMPPDAEFYYVTDFLEDKK
jgi:predicted deacetylase